MMNWLDTRNDPAPIGFPVLIYVRMKHEAKFIDFYSTGMCHYKYIKDENGKRVFSLDPQNSKWHIQTPNSENGTFVSNWKEVISWTLFPNFDSALWVDIDKYPPPKNLKVLVYLKDLHSDTGDRIIDSEILKIRPEFKDDIYREVYWTLCPTDPKMINDDYI
jgi:hypothetical protein